MVKVLFFASARDSVGTDEMNVDMEGHSLADLHAHLVEQYPSLHGIKCLALNGQYITLGDSAGVTLKKSDEVAFIPPVSGG
ncbi:MAG: hypothetical protein MHM6MM_001285 [Cercozoa sp. M6MM]